MKRRHPGPLRIALLAAALSGCARCGDESGGAPSGAAATSAATAAARPSPPEAWKLATVRGPPGVAAPERCRFRAPLLRATVPPTTNFAADSRTLGVLVVADTLEHGEVLRAGSLAFNEGGATTPGELLPWPDAKLSPRVARLGERWVVAWDAPAGRSASEVKLFRGADPPLTLGKGEAFTAADLACGAARCALLTSRAARVAPAGADVVLFEAEAQKPAHTIAIEPPEAESTARPFGLASVDGARGVVAVLADAHEASFWSVEGEGGPAPLAKLAIEHGLLEAMWLGERPLLLAHGNVVDEQGCAREGADAAGAKLRFVRGAEAAVTVSTPGPPLLAALRPLGRGALALWLSPLGCGAERRVVYAVLVNDGGAPAAAPIPVADGDTFAVAVSGADVDLWIRRASEVSWLRLTCDAP